MKTKFVLLITLFFSKNVFSQNIMNEILQNKNRKNVTGETFMGVQTSIPLSLSSTLGGGKINVPPTYFYLDHGILNNITIGALVGFASYKSKNVSGSSAYSLLSAANQLLWDTDSNLAKSLGIDGSKSASSYAYKTNYLLLGGRLQYHFNAGPKTSLYSCLSLGYKAGKNRIDGASTGSSVADDVIQTYNQASKIFYSVTTGVHWFVDKTNTFGITLEGGYGYGFGDDIVVGVQSILLNVGAVYHVSKFAKRK